MICTLFNFCPQSNAGLHNSKQHKGQNRAKVFVAGRML